MKHLTLTLSLLCLAICALGNNPGGTGRGMEGRLNNVKMTLLSIGSGSTRISYERALNEKNSAELTLGFVGLGFDILHDANPRGGIVKAAYKWNLMPQKNAGSPLAGLYAKGELIGAAFGMAMILREKAPARWH